MGSSGRWPAALRRSIAVTTEFIRRQRRGRSRRNYRGGSRSSEEVASTHSSNPPHLADPILIVPIL